MSLFFQSVTSLQLHPPSSLSFPNRKPKPPMWDSKLAVFTVRSEIPARDRVIDFGRYKGRMMGTLPSTYLNWVSTNLRARDFEEYAKLADQVLQDPVYQDRVEWEFAQKVLNGDVLASPSSSSSSAVSALVEISERFGWDNDDKLGWSKLNFELLGTSNGGRIPRIAPDKNKGFESKVEGEDLGKLGAIDGREARRERIKLKRRSRPGTGERGGIEMDDEKKDNKNQSTDFRSRFPGREGLLRKVLDTKGRRGNFF